MNNLEVVKAIEEIKIIPLFYHADKDIALEIVKACYNGGARVIEFTHRGDKAMEVFKHLVSHSADMPELILGIGSLSTAEQAKEYVALGANFIVTPVLRKPIAAYCMVNGIAWMPGCATPTEMATAHDLGASLVKLFPAHIYGTDFVKAVLAPMPWLKIMATGGVRSDASDLQSWFNAGVVSVGLGSQLISKRLVEEGDFEGLRVRVRECISNQL